MLTCLRVSSFAIIESLEVELEPGLNVVTGETGAGKSILVDALELVLGARGRPEVVRTGAEQAEVEALFDVSDAPAVRAQVAEAGLGETAGEELLVRRVVQAGGRTRAYVNGRLATAAQLADIAGELADISSQHEHHMLVDPSTHAGYLDAFAELGELRAACATQYEALSHATLALEAARAEAAGRGEREDLLRFQIAEIDEMGLAAGEEAPLREERERLRHAHRLASVAGAAEDALYARDASVSEELARIAAEVTDAARLDRSLEEVATQLDAARAQVEEAARELGRYARGVTADPDRLAEIDERLDRLGRLKRKYGGSVEAVLEHRARAGAELERLEHHEERIAALEREHAQAYERAARAARELSTKRKAAATKLATAMSKELGSLGMGGAKIVVDVAQIEGGRGDLVVDGARLTPSGIDRVEFLIAPNKGEEARPLRKIASGGELSRAMLAVKRVLAAHGPGGLYVFDEVDAGVGGAVAEVIGRKLRDVARHHQVVCITHLPQIAVFADAHYRVRKDVTGGRTRSAIDKLGAADRLEEIARMLGGLKVSPKTRAAAAEMLKDARA